jgi:hypothetical protein
MRPRIGRKYSAAGGAKKLNAMLGGDLEHVLDQFAQGMQSQAAC